MRNFSIFLLLLVTCAASIGLLADYKKLPSIIYAESFEDNKSKNKNTPILKPRGTAYIDKGFNGSGLHLPEDGSAQLENLNDISVKSGTLSFWIKPLWDRDDSRSHPFVTFRWGDKKNSYFAISQGWWEPKGSGRLYFILTNQEFVHCSAKYKFEVGAWTMIAAVWEGGDTGYCRLYIDGELVSEQRKQFTGEYNNKSPIYIGADNGATDQRGRALNGVIDELQIYDRPLTGKKIAELYQYVSKEAEKENLGKWRWLREGLELEKIEKRDKEGRLLESRIIFDEGLWATSRVSTDQILNQISKAGFNVYVPCVWHGRGVYYLSDVAISDQRLKQRISHNDDPLTYLIKKAHKMGIEVHPWFTVVKRESEHYKQYYDDGTPEGAFNVHDEKFREFIVNLILDVVTRYDIDGVNLDYIRTMGICTSANCEKDYYQKYGHDLNLDYYSRPMTSAARNRIQDWQDNAVAEIVREVSLGARKIRPEIIISVDGHPVPRNMPRPLQGRNEIQWESDGLIDVIFNMDYRDRIDYVKADSVRNELAVKERMILLFGNYSKVDKIVTPKPGLLVANYAEYAQKKWPGSGVAFYLYNQLSDEQVAYLRRGPFSEAAFPYWATQSKSAH